ncbi:MAG TPA: rhomboid family intramembrane serine protease [Bacteroidetes bacterium]|nr:rhomboid family intramembrane serine protease [Bacteroidota bacterium]HCN37464.1 rhomboid family intramembrane serine protease [Bacteroidota bacterium]
MSQYNRNTGGYGGFSIFPPVLKILLVVNISVFIIQYFFLSNLRYGDVNVDNLFLRYLALMPIGEGFMPWQLFTYMFLHGSFMHIFMNMFVLWMFGFELENIWGSKKFLIYYLSCGVAAGMANEIIAPFLTDVGPTVGASGAIYGILAAFAYLFPNRPIYIYFLFPIKAKYVILLYMAIDLINVIGGTSTGIAHIAHLGGAVAGFLYLFLTSARQKNFNFRMTDFRKQQDFKKQSDEENIFRSYSNGTSKENIKEVKFKEVNEDELTGSKDDYIKEIKEQERLAQERIDKILDKISKGGWAVLTEEEKMILRKDSKNLR